ncbi:hypothetical protein OL548_16750 [Lysinibacillus sp. MHQ-1]|nr:hypothetical protein OL548_16750 [Lysinibacillus sp. MHQ-1]
MPKQTDSQPLKKADRIQNDSPFILCYTLLKGGKWMFKRETSIGVQRHGDVQCALGKVAVQGFGMSVYSFFC